MFQYKNTKTKPDFQLKKVKVENKFTFFNQSKKNLLYLSCKREIEIGFLFKKQA